jgi:hypothetical protein
MAMMKVAWLLRRKPGITHEPFRDHYESSHAMLGQGYFGHLITSYTRNYNPPTSEPGPDATPFDRVIAAKSWEHFLDRSSVRLVRCGVRRKEPVKSVAA